MGLKIAVAGKGGVGKTTLVAVLARLLGREGFKVLAVDADPDSNLAAALGVPAKVRENIVPLSRQIDLIREKTGIAPGESYGAAFILNPDVSDIVERYGVGAPDEVTLLVAGTIEKSGSGCFCPESALLRALFEHLVLDRKEFVIFDMEAGLEHLGRGTTKGVDLLVIVVEPGSRSLETALKIKELSAELGIYNVAVVINKLISSEGEFISRLGELGLPIIGTIPYDEALIRCDIKDQSVLDVFPEADSVRAFQKVKESILKIS